MAGREAEPEVESGPDFGGTDFGDTDFGDTDFGDTEFARRRALAATAHDLLNPITAVIGFTDTLLDRWDVLDDEAKLAALRTIRRQGEQLRRLARALPGPGLTDTSQY
jgi:hypothetical protein